MTDFTLNSKQILLNAVNDQRELSLTDADVEFINLTPLTTGDYNTTVTCSSLSDGNYRDSAPLSYNRVPIAGTFTTPIVFMTLGNVKSSTDLIQRINTQYNRALGTDDIIVETLTVTAVSETIGTTTLRMAATSLIYTGELTVYFGSASDISDWLHNPVLEYDADGKNFTFSGGYYRETNSLTPGNQVSIVIDNTVQGIQIDSSGLLSTFNDYGKVAKVLARIQNQQVVEILGSSGETSYDANGLLVADLPILPPDFNSLLDVFHYTGADNAGHRVFSTDFKVNRFWLAAGTGYYVDTVNGSNSGEGTASSPLKSLDAALTKTPLAAFVVLKGGQTVTTSTNLSRRSLGIICTDDTPAIITGAYQGLTWTKTSNASVWSTPFPGAFAGIVDYGSMTTNGGPTRLSMRNSVTGLLGGTGVYYTDNTTLYVITADGRQPDDNLRVIQSGSGILFSGQSTGYLSNVTIQDTDEGFAADALATDNYPTCYLDKVNVVTTCKNACLNSYGAVVYNQDCTGLYGYKGGTYYGTDRQTIPLGALSEFIEVNGTFTNFVSAGSGQCFGSSAVNGAVGIRFGSQYNVVSGFPVNDYGSGTITANFNVFATGNLITDIKMGALFNCGDTSSSGAGRAVQMILSSLSSNTSTFTFINQGLGETHLYNTLVGPIAQYGLANPYHYIYTNPVLSE